MQGVAPDILSVELRRPLKEEGKRPAPPVPDRGCVPRIRLRGNPEFVYHEINEKKKTVYFLSQISSVVHRQS